MIALSPRSVGVFSAVCFLGLSRAAHAQPNDSFDDEAARHKHYESPQNFALEFRFGPYRPNIDSAFPAANPYAKVFGDAKGFYSGVELDWQALRIPYLGSFGPGVSWGYNPHSAKALLSSTHRPSAEDTYLTIMPMYAVGVLRIDYLARSFGVPFVGYAKAGLGFALWSTGDDGGVATSKTGLEGRGRSWGSHLALGGAFLLDSLDRTSARDLDNSIGVNHSYVFVEWMRNDLGTLSLFESRPQLRVGTSTWVMGLAFEM